MYTEQKLAFFYNLVNCNYALDFWVYDTRLNLISTTSKSAALLDGFFSISGCREYLKKCSQDPGSPVLLSDPVGLIWAADYEFENGQPVRIHILGPAFINSGSIPRIEKQLDLHHLSVSAKMQTLRVLEKLPLIPFSMFSQYIIMFHYCLSGEHITSSHFLHQTSADPDSRSNHTDSKDHAPDTHTGIHNIEQQLLILVEQGNMNYEKTFEEASRRSYGIKASFSDPLQQAIYSVIAFITLCCRAAISGGLPASTAYSLNDMYIQAAGDCTSITELMSMNHTMFEDFISRVHQVRTNPAISKPIASCCDYINMHVEEKISISDLAKLAGYTEYYLSRKFRKETNVSINQYINTCKITYAKMLLSSSDMSIQDISNSLNFCSRSYFADIFQKETGTSPSDYREESSQLHIPKLSGQ